MSKLKTTFHLHMDDMGEQLKKDITNKTLKQITNCIADDIARDIKMTEFDTEVMPGKVC